MAHREICTNLVTFKRTFHLEFNVFISISNSSTRSFAKSSRARKHSNFASPQPTFPYTNVDVAQHSGLLQHKLICSAYITMIPKLRCLRILYIYPGMFMCSSQENVEAKLFEHYLCMNQSGLKTLGTPFGGMLGP